MLGKDHAASGACTGLATGILMHQKLPADAALAVFTAGFALLPDMDSVGSCSARSLGFLSRFAAYVIRWACRGHRHFSHALLGLAACTGLTWLAGYFRHDWGGRVGLLFILTLAVSSGLDALGVDDHLADVIGLGAAAAVTLYGWDLALVPVAAAVGLGTHVAGDMLTDSGVMLLYPFSQYRFHLLPEPFAFSTGTRPERFGIRPALYGLGALLMVQAAVPGAPLALLHHALTWAHGL